MGTIADKLLYLNGTKQSFKTDLNAVGAEITDQTTFRNYLQWLDDLYDSTSEKTKLAEEGIEGNTKQSILPSEYTQVDYIQSSGSQYIDTGINADTKLRTILDIAYINPTNANQTMGAINIGTPNKRYHILSSSNSISFWVNDANYVIINSASTDRHLWDLNIPEGKVVLDNTTTTTISTNIDDVELSFWLFGRNSNATQYKAPFKLWACKMYYNGTLVRDYIPCYRNSDNEVGLYDLVNDVFYTNQGTGVFTYGSVIPNPDYPQEIVNISGKNTLKVVGKNLFDKNAITERSYVLNDGTLQTGTSYEYNTSDFIPVQPNTTYYKTLSLSPRTKFYDANKQVLDSSTYQDISIGGNAGTFTTPANAYYFRFTINTNVSTGVSLDSVMVHKGSEVSAYEPYQEQSFDLDLKSKNLLSYSYNLGYSTTINGITWTINQDGSITANGTASSLSIFNFADVNNLSSLIGKEVTFNGTPKNSDNEEFMGIYSTTYAPFLKISGGQEGTITITPEMTRVLVRIPAGYTVNNLTYYPMLRLSSITDDTYEQYHEDINLCKIDTYKDRIYKSTGKNLFDKNNANEVIGYFNTGVSTISSSSQSKIIYIPCNPNTTYTVSKITSSRFFVGYTKTTPALGIEVFGVLGENNKTTPTTITTSNDAKYLVAFIYHSNYDTSITYQQILDSIQIEENSTATTYEGYGKKWYLEKKMGKISFSDSDLSSCSVNGTTPAFVEYLSPTIDDIKPGMSETGQASFSNITNVFRGTTSTKKIRFRISHEILGTTSSSTIAEAKAAFLNKMSDKTMICYYVLETSTTEEITESNYPTLYEQLQEIQDYLIQYKINKEFLLGYAEPSIEIQ